MKPVLENISTHFQQSSIYAYSFKTEAFNFKWHFHPEYELTFIIKGNGSRLIGNSHQSFSDGDFVLIGPNLPHTWFGKALPGQYFEAIVIQMPIAFVDRIIDFKETNQLKSLFQKSNCGILIKEYPNDIKNRLSNIINTNGIEQMANLLNVLSILTSCSITPISNAIYKYHINVAMENRINKVCEFIQHNYFNKISLKQAADLIYMTESNFCKFFKKTTSITFSDYLNDLRIDAVCKLLLSSEDNIKNIAYDCGFESLSYFNRVFLKKKQLTPKDFRFKHSIN